MFKTDKHISKKRNVSSARQLFAQKQTGFEDRIDQIRLFRLQFSPTLDKANQLTFAAKEKIFLTVVSMTLPRLFAM